MTITTKGEAMDDPLRMPARLEAFLAEAEPSATDIAVSAPTSSHWCFIGAILLSVWPQLYNVEAFPGRSGRSG